MTFRPQDLQQLSSLEPIQKFGNPAVQLTPLVKIQSCIAIRCCEFGVAFSRGAVDNVECRHYLYRFFLGDHS